MRQKKKPEERKTREGMKCIHIPARMWENLEKIRTFIDRDLTMASTILEVMDRGIAWYIKKIEKAGSAKTGQSHPEQPHSEQQNNTTGQENNQEGWEEFDRFCKDLEEQENRKIPPND